MLCLIDRGVVGHRHQTLQSAIGEPGWLRFRYAEDVRNLSHTIETAILVRGNRHLRVHRIRLAEGAGDLSAIEGAAPFGYPPGDVIQLGAGEHPHRSWAGVQERFISRYVAIEAIAGYDAAEHPAAWRGAHDLNSVYGRYVLPALRVDRVPNEHVLTSLVTIGDVADRDATGESEVPHVTWNADDSIQIDWLPEGTVIIPPLHPDLSIP
jgi:hypothetical protein